MFASHECSKIYWDMVFLIHAFRLYLLSTAIVFMKNMHTDPF